MNVKVCKLYLDKAVIKKREKEIPIFDSEGKAIHSVGAHQQEYLE